MSTKPVATNVNAVIGKTGCVCEKIDNAKSAGAVKVDGQIWTARSTDDNITIDEGALVTVISVSGVKLICEIKK